VEGAGIVNLLPCKIDQAKRSEFICIPGIEGHVFYVLLQLSIEILFGDDQCGNREGQRIRLHPLDIGILDWRSLRIHKKLDAEIEANIPCPECFSHFFPEIMLFLHASLHQGAQYAG
jgi:hypothetical protein